MSFSTIITIDPGSSGAAVVRSPSDGVRLVVDYSGRDSVLETITRATMSPLGSRGVGALIERVWASPIMGVSAAFAFGGNYEGWIMALLASRIPVFTATPQVWQKAICPNLAELAKEIKRSRGIEKDYDARKAALKEAAVARFDLPVGEPCLPKGVRVTLKNCDALLISEYAHQRNQAGLTLGDPIA